MDPISCSWNHFLFDGSNLILCIVTLLVQLFLVLHVEYFSVGSPPNYAQVQWFSKKMHNIQHLAVLMCLVAKLCPTPCSLMDGSPRGSSVRGIFQARILEGVAISFSDFPDLGINPTSPVSPALAGGFFTSEPLGKSHCTHGHGLLQWKETMQDQEGKRNTGQSLRKPGTNFRVFSQTSHSGSI